MTSIPVESVQHVEDFGNILLQAQKDLERVRARLHALPLKSHEAYTSPPKANNIGDIFDSLKDVLARTENSLRSKAEIVLRSVEESRLQTLPAIPSMEGPRRNSAGAQPQAQGWSNTLARTDSEGSLARKAAHEKKYLRRPVRERMAESKTAQLLANPEALLARQYLLEKYALPQKQDPSRTVGRPIDKYANKTDGYIPKGSALPQSQARVLPKIFRNNPGLYPHITADDTMEGVYNLQNRGMIPTFADVGPAFETGCPPLQQAPSQFHAYHEQFDRLAIQQADHGFNLANLKLDLASSIMEDEGGPPLALPKPPTQQHGSMIPPIPVALTPVLLQFPGGPSDIMQPPRQLMQPPRQEALEAPHAAASSASTAAAPLLLTNQDDTAHARDYDELLDTYSLHQFIIRRGKTLNTTPEFVSFQRKYGFLWGSVKTVIQELEEFLVKYGIPLAYINGQKIVELAELEGRRPTISELLECLENIDKQALLNKVPGEKYKMPGGQSLASVKIQSTYKMFVQRRHFKALRYKNAKALLIQAAWKQYMAKQNTRQAIADRWNARLEAWRTMWKKFQADWGKISTKKRVVVHVPSLSLQPYQRKGMHNFAIRENSQLTRLCDAADPDVDVIYISPFELNAEISQYYLKLLEVGGVDKAKERIKILVPENATRFPEHFSLAKLALYSPRLLKRIKEYIRGRPAYLVPCELGPEDLQLAIELNIPLFSPEPDVAHLFGTKSGNKRIFAAAQVPTPVGAHDIFDKNDLYSFFAKLIVDQLDCQRWCIKIDCEMGGRGTAYFDSGSLKVIQAVRQEKAQHAVRWRMPEIIAAAQERVENALREHLPKKAILAVPDLYAKSWAAFEQAFYRVGGVIEACPAFVLGSPSANIVIEPDGTIEVSDTHDQLFSSPFVYCGATFPSTAPRDLLHSYAIQIGRACYKQGIIGHAGIDFVMWYDNQADERRLWAVDLNLRITATHASFKLFHFLMKGQYNTSNRNHLDQDTGEVDSHISYLVAPGEGEVSSDRTNTRVERHYSVVNYIYQPNLATVQFSAFFNLCRLKGVSFDLRAKSGTAFMMMDSLASATLGLLCVGATLKHSLTALVEGVGFLQEQVGALKLTDHVYADESNLVEVLNVAKAMLKVATHEEEAALEYQR